MSSGQDGDSQVKRGCNKALCKYVTHSRARYPCRNAETLHAIANGVLIATPIGDHSRQSRGYGVTRSECKPHLTIIRERDKKIRRTPASREFRWLLSIVKTTRTSGQTESTKS